MRLAKPHLDIGMFTNDIAAHQRFWEASCGLKLDHELSFGDGWVQHRYDAHGSVIKVNQYPTPFASTPPTGYAGLSIARAGQPAWEGPNPGGEPVRLVPPGSDGVVGIGITVSTPDPDAMMRFYLEALEFERIAPRVARCGDSLLFVVEGPGGRPMEDFIGPGFRYLTVQIFDADAECAAIEKRGGTIVQACKTFPKVARYGFVADPDGNWIEISARAQWTGVMPVED